MSEERSAPQGPPAGLRASDEDRERLIAELNEHAVAGRISTEELEERLQAAYAARTTGELDTLRHDLPMTSGQLALATSERRRHLTRRLIQETGGSLGLFAVCLVVWLASGAQGQFWPVWVLLVFAMSAIRNGWALYGPAPDLDHVEATLDAKRQRRLQERQRAYERGGRRRH
jgi:hypothetical protein